MKLHCSFSPSSSPRPPWPPGRTRTSSGSTPAKAAKAAEWVSDGVRANPLPVGLAAGHVPAHGHLPQGQGQVAPGVAGGRGHAGDRRQRPAGGTARTRWSSGPRPGPTRAQLLADQIGLQNRHKKLPEEMVKAEKDVCYTGQALADADRKLADAGRMPRRGGRQARGPPDRARRRRRRAGRDRRRAAEAGRSGVIRRAESRHAAPPAYFVTAGPMRAGGSVLLG